MTRTLTPLPVYARPDLCPRCWTRLDDTSCSRCGLVLDGSDARELLRVSTLVDQWLEHRSRALACLPTGRPVEHAAPQPAPRQERVPVVYARTDLCPRCWRALSGPGCAACGLRLTGPAVRDLLVAGRELDGWLAVRAGLMGRLPSRPAGVRTSGAPGAARPDAAEQTQRTWARPGPVPSEPRFTAAAAAGPSAGPVTSPGPSVAPGDAARPVPPPAPGRAARWKLTPQALLLGLGTLLVGVAAVIFLLVTWDVMDITDRSFVLGSVTVLAIGVAAATRVRLPATAEAFGALAVVLLTLDVVALRATGLFAATVHWTDYLVGATFGVAAVTAALARLTGLGAFAHGTGVLLPVGAALSGIAVIPATASAGAALFLAGAGPVAGLVIGVVAMHHRTLLGRPAVVTYCIGATLQLLTLGAFLVMLLPVSELTWAGALLGLVALAAAAHAALLPASRAWASGVVGAAAPFAMALPVVEHVPTWWVLVAPMLIGALVMALTLPRPALTGLDARVAGIAGLIVLACWTVPGAVVTARRSLAAAVAAFRPWTVGPGSRWQEVTGPAAVGNDLAVAGLGACLALCLALFVRARATGDVTRRLVLPLLAVLALTLPWWHQVPVIAVVVAGALTAAGLVLAGRLLYGHPDQPHAAVLLTAAGGALSVCTVIAAWTSEPLAAPTTLAGTAALVFWWTRVRRPVLWVPATASLLVSTCGAAASAGMRAEQLGFVTVWTGLAVTGALVVAPGARLDRLNRIVLGACAAAGTGAGVIWQAGMALLGVTVPDGVALATWSGLSALTCAVAVAADPRRLLPAAARTAAVPVAVAAGMVLGISAQAWAGLNQPALAAAVAVTAGALALFAVRRRAMGSPAQALALELGLATGALATLGLLREQAQAWPALLVLAVGVALVALLPQRRDVGWAAWTLAAAGWLDLLHPVVRTGEAFTLPPALALLAAGAWAACRDARVLRPSLVAGSSLLVLPTAVASVSGAPWRAVTVLLTALGFALGALLLSRSGARVWRRAPLVAAPAVGLAVLGPWLRGVDGLPSGPGNDLLVLGAAAAVAMLGWTYWSRPWTAAVALVLAVPPLFIVGTATQALWRVWVLTLITGTVLVLAQWRGLRPAAPRGLGWLTAVSSVLLGVGACVGAVAQMVLPGGYAVESATVPAAAVVLAVGALRMRALPDGSWRLVGPALLLGLVPSVLIGLSGGSVLRVLLVTVDCAAAVVLGIRLRWQAMILVGAGVLAVHGFTQLAPWFVLVYDTVPRWAHLAAVGAVLLVLGARYEHRMADVRMVRRRLQALR